MRRFEQQEKKLDKLFIEIGKLEENEIKAHLAKYLCVQVSGYLENVIKELVEEYHEGTCKKNTANYVNDKLKTFTNIDQKKLDKFLGTFNALWAEHYSTTVSERYNQSLNSIIAQRHLIAHGNESRSNISFRIIDQYYTDLKEIVKVLCIIISKSNP